MIRKIAIVLSLGFLALAFSTLLPACSSYDHRHHSYYDSARHDPYRVGYESGFQHGAKDSRSGLNFDYKHSEVYRHGISRDRSVNERFRDGYSKGYKDAYYGSNHGYGRY